MLVVLAGAIGLAILAGVLRTQTAPGRWRRQAETAQAASRFAEAAAAWRAYHQRAPGDEGTWLAEARAALAAGRAAQALAALESARPHTDSNPEPWLTALEILRMQDRVVDADELAWRAYDTLPASRRTEVLTALTLALLADLPEDRVRRSLAAWMAADPTDGEAEVAYLRRVAANPMRDDPPRPDRVARLERIVRAAPESRNARAALVAELADGGEAERARAVLDSWPESLRDGRYERVAGRWWLDFGKRPDLAETALRRALNAVPHDTATRYRLARTLKALGKIEDAQREAETVLRHREILEPARLGKRLEADLRNPGDFASNIDLAALCKVLGLERLARAWSTPR